MRTIFIIFTIIISILITGCSIEDKAIINGYYDKAEHYDSDSFQDYTDYCKYFYNEKYDDKFKNNKLYLQVSEWDISNIISYFENFKEMMSSSDRSDEYDFSESNITQGDYVYIKTKEGEKIGDSYYDKFDNYIVYFYDLEQHTLYYIHSNI